ncbi:hypothetical protein L1887_06639 [Cichorium endivia]|nr:hypothetical protein L1887_06639 [Cichorium endivia]
MSSSLTMIGKPHFVFVPLLAQGHMIPMIDMARLFAEQGVIVSIVTTPLNALRSATTIKRAQEVDRLFINLIEIPFPAEEVGLPPGCENLDSVPTRDLLPKFFQALDLLREPLEDYLEKENLPPSCIISDKYMYWTSKTAKKFNVPRIVFHGTGAFSLLSMHNLTLHMAHASVESDSEPFEIPDMPNMTVSVTRMQLPTAVLKSGNIDDIRKKVEKAESSSYGVVMNTFDGLEHDFIEKYRQAVNKKVWCVGPVSMCNKETSDKFTRGNKASIDEKECIGWLDSMKPKSVLYACLGSQCRLIPSQLFEIGLALEASSHPFIWVISGRERFQEVQKWLIEEKFEERNKGKGLLIIGWSPQVLILSHPAIKGFLTHCGWNSVTEGICAGVPMITWPMFSEQFLNEILIVDILKIGVRVGIQAPVPWGDEERVGIMLRKDEINKSIQMLMGRGGEQEDEITSRARELGELARKAIGEEGSAQVNIKLFIQDIIGKCSHP